MRSVKAFIYRVECLFERKRKEEEYMYICIYIEKSLFKREKNINKK